jgi:hypothetical protein
MVLRLLIVSICFAVAGIESVANGQDASQPTPATAAAFATQDEVNAIKSDVQEIKRQLGVITKALSIAMPDTPDDDPVTALEKRIEAIEKSQQELFRLGRSQGLVIEQIAARDDRGQYYPRFNGNSEQAKENMLLAIESTIPDHGDVVVTNNTDRDEWITINGDRYRIRPGKRRSIPVSPGNVITQVSGEQPKTWHLGPGNKYSQGIELNDRVVARYVYNSTPVYVDSVGWIAAY